MFLPPNPARFGITSRTHPALYPLDPFHHGRQGKDASFLLSGRTLLVYDLPRHFHQTAHNSQHMKQKQTPRWLLLMRREKNCETRYGWLYSAKDLVRARQLGPLQGIRSGGLAVAFAHPTSSPPNTARDLENQTQSASHRSIALLGFVQAPEANTFKPRIPARTTRMQTSVHCKVVPWEKLQSVL